MFFMRHINAAMGIAIMAVSLLGQVRHVQGCWVPESKVPPSNFGLAEMADVVVLAEAMKEEKARRVLFPWPGVSLTFVEPISGCVWFRLLDILKGKPPQELCLAGRSAEATGIEASWSRPRQGAMTGACAAFDYAVGHKYLLLLKADGTNYVVLSPPFARVNEEVSGRDDPWVVGIEKYIAISKLPSYPDKENALRALLSKAQPDSELHKDLAKFLRYPWAEKPVKELMRYLTPGNRLPEMRRALYLLAHQPPTESRTVVDELLNSRQAKELTSPLAEYADNHKFTKYWQRLSDVVLSSVSDPEWHFRNLLADNLNHVTAKQAIGVALKCRHLTWERSSHLDKKLRPVFNSYVGGDFAAHPEESFFLAESGDPAVAAWAKHTAVKNSGPLVGFAIQILARSPFGKQREFLADTFCNHREHLTDLLLGYRYSNWRGREDRVAELAVTPGLKAGEKNALLDLLRYWTRGEHGGKSKSVAYVLRENVEKGMPPDKFFFEAVEPLTCGR